MKIDMLRLAAESEGVRTEGFAGGEMAEPLLVRTRSIRPSACAPLPPSPLVAWPIDLRALVMRAVVPRLAENLRDRSPTRTGRPASARIPAVAPRPAPDRGCEQIVGELVDILLRDDLAGACRAVEVARACGRPLERIYLDLLAPAAAAVSRLVAADDCSAAEGVLAFCTLQLLLRRYATDFYQEGKAAQQGSLAGSRALLVSTREAGGLPTFGLLLAADFLRRAGWEPWTEHSLRSASLRETVRSQWFDLVQVLADDGHRDEALIEGEMREIAAGIRAIRRDGSNGDVVVIACGSLFAHNPDLVSQVGADHGGSDPLSAMAHLDRLSRQTSCKQMDRRRPLS